MMAYAHQRSYDSSYTLSDHSIFPTRCTALQPRHSNPTASSDMDDEESGTSASSEEEEEEPEVIMDSEEEMVLDEVIHLSQDHHQPPLELCDDDQSRSRYDASLQRAQESNRQYAEQRLTSHNSQTQTVSSSQSQQQQQQPPIVVTYGPFHSPDVDVAVAYGQMVCYLWFWQPSSSATSESNFDANALALQLQPAPHFIQFLSRVITQTQLSKTVLVLALHYLWLLKRPVMVAAGGEEESQVLDGEMGPVNRPSKLATTKVGNGSQYTVAIIALMLANKFMDDNTYTNKSWASICGVTLEKINSMEREFLIAINHSLHVDVNRFMSWIRIMQSFFTQRQSRFNLRNRRMARLPHPQLHALAPHSLQASHSLSASPSQYEHAMQQARNYSYQRQGGSSNLRPPIVYRNRAQSRPRQAPNTNRTGMPAYHSDNDAPRPRSASPHVFQFTFVPPSNPNERERTENNRNELEKGAHGVMMVARQNPGTTAAGETRPFTGHGEFGNGIGSYAYASQPLQERPRPVTSHPVGMSMETSINHSTNRTHSHPHLHLDTTTAAPVTQSRSSTAVNALVEPSPILVSSSSTSSRAPAKRSASQAFSPRTVEPPRPHPEERTHDPIHLVHPHPVRHARPAFMYNHASGSSSHLRLQPHLTAHPGQYHAQRRMNEVHGILASNERSRPNTAVEAGFASMSLAPSGVEERSFPDPAQQRNALALAQLAASYDPYTAPTFRNEGSRDDEPLRLQYYQLVQGGRGVLRCQPHVDAGVEVQSQRGSAPEPERRYPPSLSFSTPTDDEEGMSSSESSNGTGWEYQQYSQPQPQVSRYPPPPSSWVPQVSVGGGYPLPPLSVVLGESQARFASPISSISAPGHSLQPVHTPFHDLKYSMPLNRTPAHGYKQGVKYAEFANAGPPASYAPQWGLFNSPMTGQYNAPFNGSYQSPASAEESHSHLRPVPAQHHHHHQAAHGARLSYHGH